MFFHHSSHSTTGASDHFTDPLHVKTDWDSDLGTHHILNALPVAIYATDVEGRLTFYNDSASALWGFHPWLGDANWTNAWRLCDAAGAPIPYAQSAFGQPINARVGAMEETCAWRPDGTRVYFVPNRTPLQAPTGEAAGTLYMLVDVTERKAREQSQVEQQREVQALHREVNHRANNMLATIQAIARMTRSDSVQGYVKSFLGRVTAVSRAHSLLAESNWQGSDLKRLIGEELASYTADEKARLTGPPIVLRSDMTQSMALIFHELTTNAVRHGALSAPEGRVHVSWDWISDSELSIIWREENGPTIVGPVKSGFGTKLTESAVNGQLGGNVEFKWRPTGLECAIQVPHKTPV